MFHRAQNAVDDVVAVLDDQGKIYTRRGGQLSGRVWVMIYSNSTMIHHHGPNIS